MHLRRWFPPLAALALALGIAAPAAAAPAVSVPCAADADCHGYGLLYGASPPTAPRVFAMAATSVTGFSGEPLIIATPSVSAAQDFIATPKAGGWSIQFAPADVDSGFCVSQPDLAARTPVKLVPCNNHLRQIWHVRHTGTAPYTELVNARSGQAIAVIRPAAAGAHLVSRWPGRGPVPNELWRACNLAAAPFC